MTRLVAAVFGAGFGGVLAWAQLTDADRIRQMLLLEDAYIYLMMATAFTVGTLGIQFLRRSGAHALVTGEPVSVDLSPVERRHVTGSVLFGLGWAVTDACPGPIAAQLGQGLWWSLLTLVGFMAGASLHASLAGRAAAPAYSPSQ